MLTHPTQQFYDSHVSEYEEQTKGLLPYEFINPFMERKLSDLSR